MFNKENVARAAAELINTYGRERTEVAAVLGVPRSTLFGWLKGYQPDQNHNVQLNLVFVQDEYYVHVGPELKLVNQPSGQAKVDADSTLGRVMSVVKEQLGMYDVPSANDRLVEDLGADSLDLVEIIMALEDEFGFEISDEEAEAMISKTVAEIANEVDVMIQAHGKVKEYRPVQVFTPLTDCRVTFTAPVEVTPPQYMISPNCLVIIRDGSPQIIDKSHKNYANIEKALKDSEFELAFDLIDLRASIAKWSNGRIVIDGESVTLDGEALSPKLTSRMVDMTINQQEAGLNSLALFVEKLFENPDPSIIERLYDFLQANDITIDSVGDVIAFKSVESDYKDTYTKTFDNSPGQVLSMPRARVDANQANECSYGFHAMSKGYLSSGYAHGNSRILRVKIHPADVCAIPADYGSSKLRTCRYVVLDDVTESFYD